MAYKFRDAFVIPKGDYFYIYNFITCASALIENKNRLAIKDFEQILTGDLVSSLEKNGVIGLSNGELKSFRRYYSDKTKYSTKLIITDAITYLCNLNCVYCFEYGIKNQKFYGNNKRNLFKKIYNLYMDEINLVDYCFFGGEPLLNLSYIEEMSRYISSETQGKNIFSVVSNGTLINQNFIKIANEFNYDSIMITLDGPERIHDAKRMMKTGEGTFNKIVENIEKLLSDTKMLIRINTVLDSESYNYYEELMEFLINRFKINNPQSRIVLNIGEMCHPVIETQYTANNHVISEVGYYQIVLKALERGCVISNPLTSAQCFHSYEKSFVFSPDSSVYKCITGINDNSFLVGTYNQIINNDDLFVLRNAVLIDGFHNDKCYKCDYMTICNAGCKCQFIKHGQKRCRKEMFKNELDLILFVLSKITTRNDGFVYAE